MFIAIGSLIVGVLFILYMLLKEKPIETNFDAKPRDEGDEILATDHARFYDPRDANGNVVLGSCFGRCPQPPVNCKQLEVMLSDCGSSCDRSKDEFNTYMDDHEALKNCDVYKNMKGAVE